jgi:hypothetical protein
MEEQIEKLKKENTESMKRVRHLKNTHLVNAKELEVLNLNKKYPTQINTYTDEIKSLVVKKHDYFERLNKNKKSLKNLRDILNKVENSYNDLIGKIPKSERNNTEGLISMINDLLKSLKEDLCVDEKDFLEKMKFKDLGHLPAGVNEKKTHRASTLPKIKKQEPLVLPTVRNTKQSPKRIGLNSNKGIFNKYEYLVSKDKTIKPHYLIQGRSKEKLIEEKDDDSMESDILKCDYENTYDNDYLKILKKSEQLQDRNKKIEKHIKESDKLYEKKLKDIQSTIEHNANKLKSIRQVYVTNSSKMNFSLRR